MAAQSHIEVASTQGVKAGLRAYMRSLASSGLPTVQTRYDELSDMTSKRRFDTYCTLFGAQIDKARTGKAQIAPTPKAEPKPKTGIDAEIAKAQALLVELEKQRISEREAAKRAAKTPKAAKAGKGTITAEQAWVALGSNPDFKPSDLNKPASSNMLWRLNAAGKLTLA